MIFSKPTKNKFGITFIGEFHDFKFIHETLHKITDSEFLTEYDREWACNIHYEFRKGYEGQRELVDLDCYEYSNKYIEISFLWTQLFLYLSIVRKGFDSARISYKERIYFLFLEELIRETLNDMESGLGDEIFNLYPITLKKEYLFSFIVEVDIDFVKMSPHNSFDKNQLLKALFKLDSFSDEYKKFEEILKKRALELDTVPQALVSEVEYPKIEL